MPKKQPPPKAYSPGQDPATKFPIIPQRSSGGNFASVILHDRFQVLEASDTIKNMRRWTGAVPVDVWYVLDYNSTDGIWCSGYDEEQTVQQVWTNPTTAMLSIESMVDKVPLLVSGLPSFRERIFRAAAIDLPVGSEITEADLERLSVKYGLYGESAQLIDGGKPPLNGSPLRVVYDGLVAGRGDHEILAILGLSHPPTSLTSGFISWYRSGLIEQGHRCPPGAIERMSKLAVRKKAEPVEQDVVAQTTKRQSRLDAVKDTDLIPADTVVVPPKRSRKAAEPRPPEPLPLKTIRARKPKEVPADDTPFPLADSVPEKKASRGKKAAAVVPADDAAPAKVRRAPAGKTNTAAGPGGTRVQYGKAGPMQQSFRHHLMQGKLDTQGIIAAVRSEGFDVPKEKEYYVSWNRKWLRDNGFTVPEAPRSSAAKPAVRDSKPASTATTTRGRQPETVSASSSKPASSGSKKAPTSTSNGTPRKSPAPKKSASPKADDTPKPRARKAK